MPNANGCMNCSEPVHAGQTFCSTSCEVEFQGVRPALARMSAAPPVHTPPPSEHPEDYAEGESDDPVPPVLDPTKAADIANALWPAEPTRSLLEDVLALDARLSPNAAGDGHVLPTDSEERKGMPIFSGVLNYFPLAIAAVARHSKMGNDKHNPGQPLHWARGKSMDHPDCIARHLIDYQTVNPVTGEYEEARALAWRALALLEELEEKRLGKPYSRGSK